MWKLLDLDENGQPLAIMGDREYMDGAVIKLTADEFDLLCERYSFDGDRQKFKKLLDERDQWYGRQSYSTYRHWLKQTVDWLERNKQAREGSEGSDCAVGGEAMGRVHKRGQGGFQKALGRPHRQAKD